MTKRRGGFRYRVTSKNGKNQRVPIIYSDPNMFLSGACLTEEDTRYLNGNTEDAYRVQFETTDLTRVLEGV